MKETTYTIELEPAEEGGFTVTVPALPGCITEGDTYESAVASAREAIEGFLEALAKAGESVPNSGVQSETITTAVQVRQPEAA